MPADPATVTEPGSGTDPPRVVVCGLGRFGLRLVECLRQHGASVTVITDAGTREDRRDRAVEVGADVVLGDFRFKKTRERARVESARAIVLASSSDEANLETALDVRGESPGCRVVMRVDAARFARRLRSDFGIDTVLSPASVAARDFSRAAVEPSRRAAPSETGAGAAPPHVHSRTRRVSPTRLLLNRHDPHRPLLFAAFALLGLIAVAVAVFRGVMGLSWVDAAYFTGTIVTTVGFGDFHLTGQPGWLKLFGVLLMFSGVIMVAMMTSLLTNFLLSGQLRRLRAENAAMRMRDHVILCGLGTVGDEIARDLRTRGVPVVAVDIDSDAVAQRALPAGLPCLVGNAAQDDVLLKAGLRHARALVAAAGEDARNLEIGMTAQSLVTELRPDRPLQIVLRCFDAELARRVHAQSCEYRLLSVVEIAAPVFARAALLEAEDGRLPSPLS